MSSTALTASIPATDVATTATDSVTVSNPAPGGGTSTAASFSVSTSDFVLNVAGGGNATITAGQTAIYKNAVSLTDVNGFSFTVVLSCSTNSSDEHLFRCPQHLNARNQCDYQGLHHPAWLRAAFRKQVATANEDSPARSGLVAR